MCLVCEKKSAGDSFGQEIIFFEKVKPESVSSEFFVSLQIDPDKKELVLGAGTSDGGLDEEFTRAIKYCPFCGKEM